MDKLLPPGYTAADAERDRRVHQSAFDEAYEELGKAAEKVAYLQDRLATFQRLIERDDLAIEWLKNNGRSR